MKTKIYLILKQRPNQTVPDFFFDNFLTGTLTTEHAASSYNVPVILDGRRLVDYADVEAITLPFAARKSLGQVKKALKQFGIRVTAESAPAE